ncbi:MAG: LytTR family DNA-binding domain-containing protein [Bacteroidales bacterium]|nr:LytTR family DNA-binding domain-containing protein [Bacteroidales bacterium]
MKALIVEDERMAQAQLTRLLQTNFPDIEVVAATGSVRETVDFLRGGTPVDLIFMDVELADGECFEIFRQVPVPAQVIMTTAYDTYAVKAFEAGSIDYLLKPIGVEALARAVGRCRERVEAASEKTVPGIDVEALLAALGRSPQAFKERFIVSVGERIIPVRTGDIAYFFSEEKANYLFTMEGERYLFDSSLDALEAELDPGSFFRVSRGAIVSRSCVRSVSRHFSGRLRLELQPAPPFEPTVSRARVEDFLKWLE